MSAHDGRKRREAAGGRASHPDARSDRRRTPADGSRGLQRAGRGIRRAVVGHAAVAWKAGGPSDKVEPTAAPIPAENLLRSPASVAGAGMKMIGVEAEVAFRFARDLPPRTTPYPEKEIADAVGEVVVAIELCDTPSRRLEGNQRAVELADFQNNSALVVGSGTKGLAENRFPAAGDGVPDRRAHGRKRKARIPSATRSGCCPGSRRTARSAASACTPAMSSPRVHGQALKSRRWATR